MSFTKKNPDAPMKCFKYRIYPNKQTKTEIDRIIKTCWYLYNAALEERIDECRINGRKLQYRDQQDSLPFLRKNNDYFAQVPAQVLQNVLGRLDNAYKAYFDRHKDGHGKPKFQGKHRYNSFTYPQKGYCITGNKLKLSFVGIVKIKLHRPIEGKIKTCTIVRKNDRYYACFSCEIERREPLPNTGLKIGIDLGITHFYTTSDGETMGNPRLYRKAERKLRYLQRQATFQDPKQKSGKVRKKKGGKNWIKAKKLASKQHEKVANQRQFISHLAVHELLMQYDTVCHEDLRIGNMVKNRKLSKSISDAGWRSFLTMLEAKAKQAPGKRVIAVNPYLTSKTCSQCGAVMSNLTLSIRNYKCPACGLKMDRDHNAAVNILQIGIEQEIANN